MPLAEYQKLVIAANNLIKLNEHKKISINFCGVRIVN